MSLSSFFAVFRRHRGAALLVAGLTVYTAMAVRTGTCPACAVLSTIDGLTSPTSAHAAPTSEPAPSWAFAQLDGKRIDASVYAGKVVIVDFWATWCPPCRKEIPGFIDLQKKYADKGLVVLGVSLDQGDPSVVSEFVKKFSMNYPVALPINGDVPAVFGSFDAIPTTFVIDRAGRIVATHTGYTSMDEFEKEITPLLATSRASH